MKRPMHEYSVVSALIGQVEREAVQRGATSIRRIRVRVGELSGVESALLATAFATFRERTRCADAVLDILPVAARWECPICGGGPDVRGVLRCPVCDVALRLAAGDDLVLEQIEMEVA